MKLFKLIHCYDGECLDEYFCQEKNITLAKKMLLSFLKPNEKPICIYEYVKKQGWKIKIEF